MKVEAQYEVLGNDVKRDIRPGRDDRNVWLLISRYTASRAQAANRSSLGDGPVLQHLTQHFVLSYFH